MDTNGDTCGAKVGLLTLRDCERPAVAKCERCGCPVCGKHRVESESGAFCPECAARAGVRERKVRPARYRHSYYDHYHYSPYYYGHHHYYHDYDYRSFESGETVGGGQAVVEGEGGEFGGAGATDSWEEAPSEGGGEEMGSFEEDLGGTDSGSWDDDLGDMDSDDFSES